MQLRVYVNSYNQDPYQIYIPDSIYDPIFTVTGPLGFPSGTVKVTKPDQAVYMQLFNTLSGYKISLQEGNDKPWFCDVKRLYSNDGIHIYIEYEIDWVRSYARWCQDMPGGPGAINGFINTIEMHRVVKPANNDGWNRWLNDDIPVTGKQIINTYYGEMVKRITTVDSDGAYLVVYKSGNASSLVDMARDMGITAVLIDGYTLYQLLSSCSSGDFEAGGVKYRAKFLVSAIQGIYYMPNVTVNLTTGTTTLSGVGRTLTGMYIPWVDENGNNKFVDGITGVVLDTTSQGRNVLQIQYNTLYACATTAFDHKITYDLNDYRDIYYTAYKMYVPYIGSVDVPIALFATYPNALPDTVTFGFTYTYDIYSGNIGYYWTGYQGIHRGQWHPLPSIPITYNGANFDIQQTNSALAINAAGAAMGALVGTAGGYPPALTGFKAIQSIAGAVANAEISKNAAAATGLQSTSSANFAGYADNAFILTVVKTETVDILEYYTEHGYPVNAYPHGDGLGSNFTVGRIWATMPTFHSHSAAAAPFNAFAGEMKSQFEAAPYWYFNES